MFFLVFKNLNQKNQKNSRKTKKKHLLTWNQNFSKKFCFFGFLVFSRFCKNPFLLKEKSFIKGGRVFTTLHDFLKI